jgi:hypothetical protein
MHEFLIPLTQGYSARVSQEDFLFLNQWKWCVSDCTRGGNVKKIYAVRGAWICSAEGARKYSRIYMHREIMVRVLGSPESLGDNVVDHGDADTLNNTRENLWPLPRSENAGYSHSNQKRIRERNAG